MLEQILKQCGMVGNLLLSGEDPDKPGHMMSIVYATLFIQYVLVTKLLFSCQTGVTALGYTFKQTHRGYIKDVQEPFIAFANKCICKLYQIVIEDEVNY